MNPRLVHSLADAIAALPPDDYTLFQQTLLPKLIQKTPGVAGGHACIRDTRIALWTLISLIQQGADEPELLQNFPSLTPFDLWAAQAHYQADPTEIDAIIASHQEL